MTFTKTSQKFGQWSDVRANTVYGLGFSSEVELNKVSYDADQGWIWPSGIPKTQVLGMAFAYSTLNPVFGYKTKGDVKCSEILKYGKYVGEK